MSSLMQYLAISPLFIVVYHKKPRTGIVLISVAILCSLLITISPSVLMGVKPWHQMLSQGIRVLSAEFNHSVNWFHTTPNVHLISYLIGICFGFLFNKKDIQFSDKLVPIFWISSVTAIVGTYYWNDTFWKAADEEPALSVLLWHSIGKVFFSTSYGWIFFASCTGRAGIGK